MNPENYVSTKILIESAAAVIVNYIVSSNENDVPTATEFIIFDSPFPASASDEIDIGNISCSSQKGLFRDILNFVGLVHSKCDLEDESIVRMIVYIKRMVISSDYRFKISQLNWKLVVLSFMALASKVGEDFSVWNIIFVEAVPGLETKLLNKLELVILKTLEFRTFLSPGDFHETLNQMVDTLTELYTSLQETTTATATPPPTTRHRNSRRHRLWNLPSQLYSWAMSSSRRRYGHRRRHRQRYPSDYLASPLPLSRSYHSECDGADVDADVDFREGGREVSKPRGGSGRWLHWWTQSQSVRVLPTYHADAEAVRCRSDIPYARSDPYITYLPDEEEENYRRR